MAAPIVHRVDHVPVFVLLRDSAWDNDRITREERQIEHAIKFAEDGDPAEPLADVQWTDPKDHPIARYHGGVSRYDLRTVEAYLLPNERPTKFVLRRLCWADLRHVRTLIAAGSKPDAFHFALRAGLHRVTDCPGLPEWPGRDVDDAPFLTERQADKLRSIIGDVAADEIGAAVYMVSREITDAEGKR